jgi:hypothetical protein
MNIEIPEYDVRSRSFTDQKRRSRNAPFCESITHIIWWGRFLMLTDGVWAEVEVGGECLRLFSEHNAQGIQASVYNVKTKTWIAPSESVDDVEQGKQRAADYASAYLMRVVRLELPALQWKGSRSR